MIKVGWKLEYRGYTGKAEFDDETKTFYGEVANIRDTITFQGRDIVELEVSFRESVDDYLSFCERRGEEPNIGA